MDLVGQTFGKLTVESFIGSRGGHRRQKRYWKCKCVCGVYKELPTEYLTSGHSRSCGKHPVGNLKHGHCRPGKRTSIYRRWYAIIQRTTNPNDRAWQWYGGRGIRVCERWLKFENFLGDMGEPPAGLSIDRIDVNGDYEPNNCRWATSKQQAHNKRTWGSVLFRASFGKWVVRVTLTSGERKYVGSYADKESAIAVAQAQKELVLKTI